MKKLITLILIAFATTAFAQQTLPLTSWGGQYFGSDTLISTNGDSVILFGYITHSEVRYEDTASVYRYELHKVILSGTDTNYSVFRFNEFYGKSDTLLVGGQNRSGRWLLNYHYDSQWRNDDKNISKALFRKKRDIIGW
jgi:hypothetical protein